MTLQKKQDKIAEYLLSQERTNLGYIFLGINAYSSIKGITVTEFIDELLSFQDYGYIDIKFQTKKDGTSPCSITPHDGLIHYFDYKHQKTRTQFFTSAYDIIKFVIPTAISMVSLAISYIAFALSKTS